MSQNLAHLESDSHKKFQISQNFQNILQHILWRNQHKTHFVVFITSFLHLNKGFWLFWGSSKVIFVKISQNFIESHLKICLISQISVHSLCHVCPRVSWMTTYLGKSCSFGFPRVPFVNCRHVMYLVISLMVLRAGCGIWLYQFLIIAYLFTLLRIRIRVWVWVRLTLTLTLDLPQSLP